LAFLFKVIIDDVRNHEPEIRYISHQSPQARLTRMVVVIG